MIELSVLELVLGVGVGVGVYPLPRTPCQVLTLGVNTRVDTGVETTPSVCRWCLPEAHNTSLKSTPVLTPVLTMVLGIPHLIKK